VTQPKTDEERLGQVFILAEIKQKVIRGVSASDCQKFIDMAVKSIKNNYYYTNKNNYEAETIELLFEAAIQKTNRELHAYLLQEKKEVLEDFLENTNIAIGVALKHQAHFAVIGNTEVFLVRKNRISDVLGASNEAGSGARREKVNPAKIFSHLISGHLETGDGLVFCTPNLLDYFSLEKIKRIIIANPVNKITHDLAGLLGELEEKISLAAIVIKLGLYSEGFDERNKYQSLGNKKDKNLMIFKKPAPKKNVQDSIAELLNRQEQTNKIITPSIRGVFRKLVPRFLKKRREKGEANKELATTITAYKEKGGMRSQHFPNLKQRNLLAGFFTVLAKIFSPLLKLRKVKVKKVKKLPDGRKRRMSFVSKAILVICIIFGIVFVQSLIKLGRQRSQERNIALFDDRIKIIVQEKEKVQSRLIIGDRIGATTGLSMVLESIAKISPETEEQKKELRELELEIMDKLNEINKIEIIGVKKEVDLGLLSFFSEEAPEKMAALGNMIYIATKKNLFTYNLDTGEVEKFIEFNLGKIKNMRVLDEENLLVNYNSSLAKIDLGSGSITRVGIGARDDLVITDFGIYNNRLYVMDAGKNMIFKYQKSGDNFGSETNWIIDDIDIREGAGLGIDGSVWVLKTNGDIIKLTKGAEEEFSAEEIRPETVRTTKIWTETEGKNLYILDTPTKRITILSKEGKIISQYTNDNFGEVKDFFADEADSKVYVLDDTSIYSFEIDFEGN